MWVDCLVMGWAMRRERALYPFILVALFALALAASTGVLLRFGLIAGMPGWAQNYGAVRHAHSHLMYFGWVTLALMTFVWADLPRHTGRPLPRAVAWQLTLTAIIALLSYPAFWSNGYGLTQIGRARLPLGSMMATFNGLTWFFFVGLYVKATWRLPKRSISVQLWDWAIVLLLVASGGAVGLVWMVFTHSRSDLLMQLFLHQFLDLFAVGWFNLALLGVIWSRLGASSTPLPRWLPTISLAVLLTPTFLLGVSPAVLPPVLFWPAVLADIGAAALLAVHLWQLWQRRGQLPHLSWLALGALGVTILTAFVLLIPGLWSFGAGGQLRVFFLHDLLLGWVSTMLVVLVEDRFVPMSTRSRQAINLMWGAGVLAMLVALLGLGFAFFLPMPALLWLQIAAWASIPVALAAIALLAVAVGVGWRREPL